MPGTCESLEVTMSAISSWFLTRRIATKSNSPVTEYASATPGTSASAGPSLAIADRSASISTMAVTTKGILSPRLPVASPRRSEVGYSAPGLVPGQEHAVGKRPGLHQVQVHPVVQGREERRAAAHQDRVGEDRKSTRLNSSHGYISYAV